MERLTPPEEVEEQPAASSREALETRGQPAGGPPVATPRAESKAWEPPWLGKLIDAVGNAGRGVAAEVGRMVEVLRGALGGSAAMERLTPPEEVEEQPAASSREALETRGQPAGGPPVATPRAESKAWEPSWLGKLIDALAGKGIAAQVDRMVESLQGVLGGPRTIVERRPAPALQMPAPSGGAQAMPPLAPRGGAQAAEAAEGAEGAEAAGVAGAAGEGAEAAGALGGAGAMGAIGAVAAPIAVVAGAVLAVKAACDAAAKAMDFMREQIGRTAESMKKLAGNDTIGAIGNTIQQAGSVFGKIPVVGRMMESGMGLAAGALISFKDVVEAFVQRGRELEAYSPALAMANAQADIKSMMADIREANELGPRLANLTTGWTDLQIELRSIMLPIKEFILGVLKDMVDYLKTHTGVIVELMQAGVGLFQAAVAALEKMSGKDMPELHKAMSHLKERTDQMVKELQEANKKKEPETIDFFLQQMKALEAAANAVVPIGPESNPFFMPAAGPLFNPLGAP